MRQRLGSVSIVQQQQTEVVVRAQVLGAFDENLLEDPLRGDGVAFALPMQRSDGEVDLKIEVIGMARGQPRKDVARLAILELPHQANGAIVERNLRGSQPRR